MFKLRIILLALGSFTFSTMVAAASLRDRAIKLEEAVPDMHLFADFETTTPSFDDLEEWKSEDIELQKQIAELEAGLGGRLTKSEKFDLHEKLVSYYLVREVYLRDHTTREYVKKFDLFQRGEIKEEPFLDLLGAENEIFKAIGHLRSIVGAHKSHPRLGGVVYELARNLCRINNDNNRFYFRQFERRFMKTSHKQKFLIARADCRAHSGNLAEAIVEYQTFLKEKKYSGALKSYAAYKLGWIYIQQYLTSKREIATAKLAMAQRSLKLAIKYADDDSETRHVRIYDQALKDLGWVFAIKKQSRQALSFYEKNGGPQYLAYYLYRAGLQDAQSENYQRAISQFNLLGKKFKEFELSPFAYFFMLESYEKLSGFQGMTQTLGHLANFVDDDHPWYEAHEDNTAFVKEIEGKVKFIIADTAAKFTEAAANDERVGKGYLPFAAESYQIYLKSFPEAEDYVDTKFGLASIYFELESMKKAAKIFGELNEDLEETHALKRDSAYNEILALSHLDQKTKKPKVVKGLRKEELDLPPLKERLMDRMIAFVETYYPKDKASTPMRFSISETYMEYGHYEDALENLEQIAFDHADSELGQNALQTIVAFYSTTGQWRELKEKVMEYLEEPTFLIPETNKLLNTYLSQTEKQIQTLEAKKMTAKPSTKKPLPEKATSAPKTPAEKK